MSSDLFAAYEVHAPGRKTNIPAFFIESTAPDNLDEKDGATLETPQYCVKLDSVDAAVDRIAERLVQEAHPKLVITVHGFNSPRPAVLKNLTRSFLTVNDDEAIHGHGVVCMGYRWPSEHMFWPWKSGVAAAPSFLIGVLAVALIAFYLVNFVFDICGFSWFVRTLLTGTTAFAAVVPLTLFGLRLIVYFRDQYRATTYGVPDLVDVIRLIDAALAAKFENTGQPGKRADLSFIGHSMGGFVVTNTVRVVSDVFSPAAPGPKTQAVGVTASPEDERSKIGKALLLRRLLLVSPDIPAEVLMSGRANALQSSVARFQEAHLFSNEADEVLHDISTTANFFALPTKRRAFGYRMGNVGVLTPWGITKGLTCPQGQAALDKLRVGDKTLQQLYEKLGSDQFQAETVKCFTYFDCTDCVEDGKAVLSGAGPGKPADLTMWGHLMNLVSYTTVGPDVHSGYFVSATLGRLIYRFACIG
ncbi:MAG TPA: hypothetical protein VEH02_05490, partial [Pseudolabrys sp.]|nr:hypothetical protein [Pseudolabrys sp.]